MRLQVESVRAESAGLRSEVEGLRRSADESREAEAERRGDFENMRGEMVMLSKTFSDFVRRYRQVFSTCDVRNPLACVDPQGAIQYSPEKCPKNCPEKCPEKPFRNYS